MARPQNEIDDFSNSSEERVTLGRRPRRVATDSTAALSAPEAPSAPPLSEAVAASMGLWPVPYKPVSVSAPPIFRTDSLGANLFLVAVEFTLGTILSQASLKDLTLFHTMLTALLALVILFHVVVVYDTARDRHSSEGESGRYLVIAVIVLVCAMVFVAYRQIQNADEKATRLWTNQYCMNRRVVQLRDEVNSCDAATTLFCSNYSVNSKEAYIKGHFDESLNTHRFHAAFLLAARHAVNKNRPVSERPATYRVALPVREDAGNTIILVPHVLTWLQVEDFCNMMVDFEEHREEKLDDHQKRLIKLSEDAVRPDGSDDPWGMVKYVGVSDLRRMANATDAIANEYLSKKIAECVSQHKRDDPNIAEACNKTRDAYADIRAAYALANATHFSAVESKYLGECGTQRNEDADRKALAMASVNGTFPVPRQYDAVVRLVNVAEKTVVVLLLLGLLDYISSRLVNALGTGWWWTIVLKCAVAVAVTAVACVVFLFA